MLVNKICILLQTVVSIDMPSVASYNHWHKHRRWFHIVTTTTWHVQHSNVHYILQTGISWSPYINITVYDAYANVVWCSVVYSCILVNICFLSWEPLVISDYEHWMQQIQLFLSLYYHLHHSLYYCGVFFSFIALKIN